jgi:hypothetical protein
MLYGFSALKRFCNKTRATTLTLLSAVTPFSTLFTAALHPQAYTFTYNTFSTAVYLHAVTKSRAVECALVRSSDRGISSSHHHPIHLITPRPSHPHPHTLPTSSHHQHTSTHVYQRWSQLISAPAEDTLLIDC